MLNHTTRSGKALEEPSIPLVPSPDVSKPQKEPEQNPRRQRKKVAKSKIGKYRTCPSFRGRSFHFIEIPKPKAKKPDVEVRSQWFTFLADFVVVNFEPDPRVPIILGRPFLRTAKALIDLYEEKLTLRVGKEELFTDELAPLDSLPPGNDDSTLKKEFHEVNFQVYSNPLFEFDESFRSSNVNPLFEENNKDVEIKSSSSSTLTLPQGNISIPPGIDLTLPNNP
ncbi:reverse transcriptase domain-containing protein [Tanacetum coccineum]